MGFGLRSADCNLHARPESNGQMRAAQYGLVAFVVAIVLASAHFLLRPPDELPRLRHYIRYEKTDYLYEPVRSLGDWQDVRVREILTTCRTVEEAKRLASASPSRAQIDVYSFPDARSPVYTVHVRSTLPLTPREILWAKLRFCSRDPFDHVIVDDFGPPPIKKP